MGADGSYAGNMSDDTEFSGSDAWIHNYGSQSVGIVYHGNSIFEQALYEFAKSF